jgi:RNA polymerase sigma factor (sigma-70 family)
MRLSWCGGKFNCRGSSKKLSGLSGQRTFTAEMHPTDDSALLREFLENRSDEAFSSLVARHINLVYSVALRYTGNPHHAEEITQAVFLILAKKATQLCDARVLSSWLFQTTRLTATNFLRSEMRRQNREQEAYMQSALNGPESDVWPKLAPLLDDAVAGLREKDRQAILLRFYEGRNMGEVGVAMGTSEPAAEKRVSRALDKLRRFFSKRGVNSTTTIISGVIASHSVQAAPATLAKSVTAAAIAKGAVVTGSTLTLIQEALKIMAWSKAKTAIIIGVVVVAAIGTTAVLLETNGSQPDIQGVWVGTAPLPGYGVHAGESPKSRMVMRVVKTNDTYLVSGDSIDQGYKDIPIDVFSYKGRHIHAEISTAHDSFDGAVNFSGTKITGAWRENNDTGPLQWMRTTNPPPFPEALADDEFMPRAGSDLQGFWAGMIGTGKQALQINVKIAESTNGTFRADFFCPPQGGGRQPTAISYDGTTVKIMPMAGYGMFEGNLSDGGRKLVGNWIQNGGHIPTTFTLGK